ncbi:MAG TPA: DUF559 domain-containing protein [Rhodanobacteraceae bacterium]|nr:DUF559 domain-containing protein [Rhodanobacteraceae bacterium]
MLDFVCLDRKLVVELDGSQHAGQVTADELRTPFLEGAGFGVLRFWNNQVFEDIEGVLDAILQALKSRPEPHPHPPPQPSP